MTNCLKLIRMFAPHVNTRAAVNALHVLTKTHEDGRLWIGEGDQVKTFEHKLKEMFDFPYCVALNSGTAGLRLALAMCGVGPGDEVITTAMTCTATNTPILEQFAVPVFADIQYSTGNIDPADIRHRITAQTAAIIVVHWAGYPCDMSEIMTIGHKYGLPIITDAAHALGATYRSAHVGTIADYTICSFQAIKHITTGDGGLLTMKHGNQYQEAKRRRWFGIDREKRIEEESGYQYWNQTEVGYKYHMNDIAASIGLGNLEDFYQIAARRKFIADKYYEELSAVSGVTLFERKSDRQSAHWLFTMHVAKRNRFRKAMLARGVETSVVHVRNDRHDVFGGRRDDLPQLDNYEKTNISIPIHSLLSDDDIMDVIEAVKGGW